VVGVGDLWLRLPACVSKRVLDEYGSSGASDGHVVASVAIVD
jgi:hypothetical protein